MKTYFKEIRLSTNRRFELVDITGEVEKTVAESGVKNGLCLVYAPHATAAIIVNEHEHGLINDIIEHIVESIPPDKPWQHNRIDDNAHAHIASAIIGSSRLFPVRNSMLVRGTWQNIFFVELDGPRSIRRVLVEVIGE